MNLLVLGCETAFLLAFGLTGTLLALAARRRNGLKFVWPALSAAAVLGLLGCWAFAAGHNVLCFLALWCLPIIGHNLMLVRIPKRPGPPVLLEHHEDPL